MFMSNIQLTVNTIKEERQKHVRISYEVMDDLNIKTKDLVEIMGKRITSAKCLPHYASDSLLSDIIRMDDLIQKNSQVEINEKVELRKIGIIPAKEVHICATKKVPTGTETYVSHVLDDLPLNIGDEVTVPYFEEVFRFHVVDTQPLGTVIVNQETKFILERNISD